MIRFESDYLEGAHPEVLRALTETNAEQTLGYGEDHYCRAAADRIRAACSVPEAAVHFLMGGTQANRTVIASMLRPHQGVVSAESGHIAAHETGAVESSGHKVITLPAFNGKLRAEDIDALCRAHSADPSFEHIVQPGMVYISESTEIGTVYSKAELASLHSVCRKWSLPLFIDGARLGCALASEGCDCTLPDIAALCDVFTIGGTKQGALFGEAVVFTKPELAKDFRYMIKQGGGMLAKGRLLGVQFLALFTDDLYMRISREEIRLAKMLKSGLLSKGCDLYADSPTNQQFVILPDDVLENLKKNFGFSLWGPAGEGRSVVRFCTSWATTEEAVHSLLEAIPDQH